LVGGVVDSHNKHLSVIWSRDNDFLDFSFPKVHLCFINVLENTSALSNEHSVGGLPRDLGRISFLENGHFLSVDGNGAVVEGDFTWVFSVGGIKHELISHVFW